MTYKIESTSSEQTEQLAERLGSKLQGGEVIELVSDLGGGKTTFTCGLVRGAGSTDRVASPTFTISRQYKAPTFTIVHFDFYRLDQAGIVAAELAEVTKDLNYVTVVEWGEVVRSAMPGERLTIYLTQTASGSREIRFEYPQNLEYVMEAVKS